MGLNKLWPKKSLHDHALDSIGLIFQGFGVPLFSTWIGDGILPSIFGNSSFALSVPPWLLFLLPLTLVDYLYYWNHRLMHSKWLWPLHFTHHTANEMHWSVSSRNSLWTCFFLIYVWFQILIIYFIPDSAPYTWGMMAHGALDLWRHSGFGTSEKISSSLWFLINPKDHEMHHRLYSDGKNFGANFSLWDRLHGTYQHPHEKDSLLGVEHRDHFLNELVFPWKISSTERNSP